MTNDSEFSIKENRNRLTDLVLQKVFTNSINAICRMQHADNSRLIAGK